MNPAERAGLPPHTTVMRGDPKVGGRQLSNLFEIDLRQIIQFIVRYSQKRPQELTILQQL
jgi:hypothetical protein